jgi:multiple sugar transport system substrate-binding protein
MPDRDLAASAAVRRVSRRTFLRAAVGATSIIALAASPRVVAAASVMTPSAEVWPQVPTFAPKQTNLSGVSLSFLQWASFIPTADKETGANVTIEFVNANDIQPKASASIQAGTGPDIISFRDNWAHTYKESMSDLSDVVAELKTNLGGALYPAVEASTNVEGKYLAMPHDFGGGIMHWRKSLFAQAGATSFPQTYDEYHAVGKQLKASGMPYGQAFGHSFGDPPGWCYSLLWGYGGREVDESGKVAINSPETIQAVTNMVGWFQDAYDETGLGWDDSSNNRAFLAETISSTLNGASIWFVARNDQMPFFDDIGLAPVPAGPKGRYLLPGIDNYVIPSYSKNQDAAKEVLRWLMRSDVFTPLFLENQSYIGGVNSQHDASLPWNTFPDSVQVFKDIGNYARTLGWPGPPNQKAGLAWSKFIIVDMFGRAIQGEPVESAVKWAEGELKAIYEA